MTEEGRSQGIWKLPPRDGGPTLRVAYLFSGISRKASIASELKTLCTQSGTGLNVEEIDIYNGGSSMDLLDSTIQSQLEARIKDAQFDVVIISPPCSTWSRANCKPPPGGRPDPRFPKPCRSKQYPWGFPNDLPAGRRRAEQGNAFIHFALRSIAAAINARKSATIRILLEHPEDLGRAHGGKDPASIWQLRELRSLVADHPEYVSVVGHQCQFGVDYAKPTRLLSDIPGIEAFGYVG